MVFFLNDTATTEIYTLSLHDALPISSRISSARRVLSSSSRSSAGSVASADAASRRSGAAGTAVTRSEEHTSELQSRQYLVCRLLLDKNTKTTYVCMRVIGTFVVSMKM